ncbi:MAG: hypothetical protein GY827_10435 [Cytophagales bacterium]|nr:hypothetical protein [Cytophagales bacterium]
MKNSFKNIVKISFVLLLLLSPLINWACDCTIYEYNNIRNKSYAGVFYRYRMFNGFNNMNHTPSIRPSNARIAHAPIGNDDNTYISSPESFERFQTYEFRYNHNYKDKFNFLINVPYHINDNYFGEIIPLIGSAFDSLETTQGLGDIVLNVERLFTIGNDSSSWNHRFKLGVGISLPTGKFELVNDKGWITDPSHQAGRGVSDIMPSLQYQVIYDNLIGASSNVRYATSLQQNRVTSTGDPINYRFGNSLSWNSLLFVVVGRYSDWQFIPKTGLYFEHITQDKLNESLQGDTGGNTLFWNIGADFAYKDFILQMIYQRPINENLEGEQLRNAGRINLALIYQFGSTSKE